MNKREIQQPVQTLRIGDLVVDRQIQSVTRTGQTIELPGLSFRMLEVLADSWPAAVSRKELERRVWGDVIVSDATVRQRVRLLRQSLGEPGYIATLKGIGYRLALPAIPDTARVGHLKPWTAMALAALMLMALLLVVSGFSPGLEHGFKHFLRHG